ncbi:MAG: hypothetical protein JWO25_3185, partial [Alphaproteobacteria bacterium]|nr:hypothetical protein [Alphaproteobacteria bacterium]
GDWANEAIAHPQRIHIAHPFRDPRVIAFGAAARLKFGADPVPKPLLAAAMRGIVPDPILDRRSKASFAPLTYLGIRRHRDALADLIVRAPAEADSIFVRAKLIAALDEAALGILGMAEIHSLAGALGVLKWLELLPAWRSGVREAADSA